MPQAETEAYGGPFHLAPLPRQGFLRIGELGAVVAERPEDAEQYAYRIRGYAQRGFLHPVGVDPEDGRQPMLFAPSSAITAAALIHLTDTQIRDSDVLAKAAFSLQAWRAPWPEGVDQPGAPRDPAAWIWQGYVAAPDRPEAFSLTVQWRRNLRTGRRDTGVGLWHDPHGWIGPGLELDEDWMPSVVMSLPLDPLLPGLAARAGALRAN